MLKAFNVRTTNMTSVLEYIEEQFDLIMITEYFEESLILMKEQLGLEMEDIAFFAKNVARHKTALADD